VNLFTSFTKRPNNYFDLAPKNNFNSFYSSI